MKSAQIRENFLKFFESHQHTRVASSSLVPQDDPTLLFTNAGMNQFKDCFLGLEKRPYVRATSSQKCVRAGGKHNDLDNVGYTARHHTFFEMLGNFSFGDYFKRDAIRMAWQFLTDPAWLGLPVERLWVTVYASDDEAFDIWHRDVGLPAERILRIGDKGGPYVSDNFWAMGDTGPCGPCTEIFYDHGPHIAGGLPGTPEEDGDRYIEIWNNVFMQFNRTADGQLHPLPAPSVDTGMGLERISAVMQGVHSNYEIDLFKDLLAAAAAILGLRDEGQASLRVLADHIRSCAFLIADGVLPSNEGRGYVLRRIIRRACRHGAKLGASGVFFHRLVDALVQSMGDAYPELRAQQADIERRLLAEESLFAQTLAHGLKVFESALPTLSQPVLPGELIFQLSDTYGFPTDLTADIARERGLGLDMEGFDRCLQEQRQRSRAAQKFSVDYNQMLRVEGASEFVGYEQDEAVATVLALYRQGDKVERLQAGEEGIVVLDRTPFYARSGGQIGDSGYIGGTASRFEVEDTVRQSEVHLHEGRLLAGEIGVGERVTASIDTDLRRRLRAHHSATHLLHAALRHLLGAHVAQQGSLVSGEALRFDFSHPEALTTAQLQAINQRVNEEILANTPVHTEVMDLAQAKTRGAMALFDEKYADQVRVLSMGRDDFSIELCGGTHVQRSGDIGLFSIVSESGIAAGVRRIEAICGLPAVARMQDMEQTLETLAGELKVARPRLRERLQQLQEQLREAEKEQAKLRQRLLSFQAADRLAQAVSVGDARVLVMQLTPEDGKSLRDFWEVLRPRLGRGLAVLALSEEDQVQILVGVSQDMSARWRAGDLLKHLLLPLTGRGGGRPELAQGGGQGAEQLPAILAAVLPWCRSRLD